MANKAKPANITSLPAQLQALLQMNPQQAGAYRQQVGQTVPKVPAPNVPQWLIDAIGGMNPGLQNPIAQNAIRTAPNAFVNAIPNAVQGAASLPAARTLGQGIGDVSNIAAGAVQGAGLLHAGVQGVNALTQNPNMVTNQGGYVGLGSNLDAQNRITAAQLEKSNNSLNIGSMQQGTQTPDLTGYEDAMNKGNWNTMEFLRNSHPGDPRFAVHLQVPGLQSMLKTGAAAAGGAAGGQVLGASTGPSNNAPVSSPEFVNGTPDWVKPLISEAAESHGIPSMVLSALLKQESGFNPNVTSPVGAQGIAQFMPGTAKGRGVNPLDPKSAINGAAQYLSEGMKKYNGDIKKALAAYNAGFGAVDKYNGIPPYQETQNYVKNILAMAGEPHQSAYGPTVDYLKQLKDQASKGVSNITSVLGIPDSIKDYVSKLQGGQNNMSNQPAPAPQPPQPASPPPEVLMPNLGVSQGASSPRSFNASIAPPPQIDEFKGNP